MTTSSLEEAPIKGGVKGVDQRGRRITTKAVKQIGLMIGIRKGPGESAQEYAEMS